MKGFFFFFGWSKISRYVCLSTLLNAMGGRGIISTTKWSHRYPKYRLLWSRLPRTSILPDVKKQKQIGTILQFIYIYLFISTSNLSVFSYNTDNQKINQSGHENTWSLIDSPEHEVVD